MNWGLVGWLALGSVPSGFLGVFVLRALGTGAGVDFVVTMALGVTLLLAAAALVVKAYVTMARRRRTTDGQVTADGPVGGGTKACPGVVIRPAPTILVGVVGGLVVGMTSVGSGSLMMITLMLLYPRLQASQLVGTDLVQAIPLVAAAALGHLLFGDFQLAVTSSLLLGSIPGTILGAGSRLVLPPVSSGGSWRLSCSHPDLRCWEFRRLSSLSRLRPVSYSGRWLGWRHVSYTA